MSKEPFSVTNQQLKDGYIPAFLEFTAVRPYQELSERTRELILRGHGNALYVPVVRMLIEASLGVVTQPGVEPTLPREVATRSRIAAHYAEQAANFGTDRELFQGFYELNPQFNGLRVSRGDKEALSDPKYLASLGGAPFFDVGVVSGGALKLLKERGVEENPADVIARSTGLLAIAGIHKGYTEELINFLGVPYANVDYLEISKTSEGVKVKFNDVAKSALEKCRVLGRGCPASRIPSADATKKSLLHEYWESIVHYLVPADATVDR
jgi:hypothetical protein